MQEIPSNGSGSLIAWSAWLRSIPVDPVTGWRWRGRKWIQTVNIAGRLYVSRDAIAEFERRAAAGEFSKTVRTPGRKTKEPDSGN